MDMGTYKHCEYDCLYMGFYGKAALWPCDHCREGCNTLCLNLGCQGVAE